jgi:nucleotide-binding universal stress UspA family protein
MRLAARPRPKLARDASRLLSSKRNVAPIVAAVDGSSASRGAIGEAVRLAAELAAPIVFVYVRRRPAVVFGTPVYQRRLTRQTARARRALDGALAVAVSAGVPAEGEILEGSPKRRISEFARDRSARLIVVGSRPRKPGQSVSIGVIRSAGRPVIVARGVPQLAAAGVAEHDGPARTPRGAGRGEGVPCLGGSGACSR